MCMHEGRNHRYIRYLWVKSDYCPRCGLSIKMQSCVYKSSLVNTIGPTFFKLCTVTEAWWVHVHEDKNFRYIRYLQVHLIWCGMKVLFYLWEIKILIVHVQDLCMCHYGKLNWDCQVQISDSDQDCPWNGGRSDWLRMTAVWPRKTVVWQRMTM